MLSLVLVLSIVIIYTLYKHIGTNVFTSICHIIQYIIYYSLLKHIIYILEPCLKELEPTECSKQQKSKPNEDSSEEDDDIKGDKRYYYENGKCRRSSNCLG